MITPVKSRTDEETDPTRGVRAESSAGPSLRLKRWAAAWSLLVLTAGIVVFFSVLPATSETFPTLANLRVTLANQSVLAIVGLGVLIPLVAREFDLSVGATLGLASIVAADVMSGGSSLWVAVPVALLVGATVGTLNGLIITRAKVNAIITTFGSATVVGGITFWVSDGESTVTGISTALTDFGSGLFLGIPMTLYLVAICAAVVHYVLAHTPYGRHLYALGSNPEAAELVGLRTRRLLLSTFIIAGALAGFAGIVQIGVIGAASPQTGSTFALPALAAAFLSTAAVKPGQFNVGGLLLAILFLAVLNSGLNLAGADAFVNDIANGAALIIGVALSGVLKRREEGGDVSSNASKGLSA